MEPCRLRTRLRRHRPARPLPRRASQRQIGPIAGRAWLLAAFAAAMLMSGASSASALIAHLSDGRVVSYEPAPGSLAPASIFAGPPGPPLQYHGGPVMTSNTNYALYWDPAGGPAYPADYQPGLNTFFEDLAHDSGGVQNTDSVLTQYTGPGNEPVKYASTWGGALIDEDPYPASGCTASTICLTEEQIEAELKSYVEAHGLPQNLSSEYFVLTPPGVGNCFEAASQRCSRSTGSGVYCAYHTFTPGSSGPIIFAVDAYQTGNAYCDPGEQHPNGTTADATILGGLVHEHSESVTDPEVGSGWVDSNLEEIGDKCRVPSNVELTVGRRLGTAPDGAWYNQVLNGHFYLYQTEFSNIGEQCLQRFAGGPAPMVKKLSPKKGPSGGGTLVTVTGANLSGVDAVYFSTPDGAYFGSVPGTQVKELSPSKVQVLAPPHSPGKYFVTVTTPTGTSATAAKVRFTYK
jgi:IPT/TIG domain